MTSTPGVRPRSRIPVRLVALTPLWVYVVVQVVSGYRGTGLFGPPEILGIPLPVVASGVAFGWMLIGLGLVWDQRSRFVELLSLLLFTIPATIGLIIGPALILILQNLNA